MDETENESEMMNKQKLKPIFKRWTLHPLDEHQRQFGLTCAKCGQTIFSGKRFYHVHYDTKLLIMCISCGLLEKNKISEKENVK